MKKLETKPFALIGVITHAREPKDLKEVMVRENLPWRSFADTRDVVRRWNVSGTPTFYVLDHAGVIRYKWVGPPGEKVLDAAIDALIREAEAAAAPTPK